MGRIPDGCGTAVLCGDGGLFARDVPPARLGDAIRGLRALGFAGANVTIPHKVEVMKYIDRTDPAARSIGAVRYVGSLMSDLVRVMEGD